MRFAVRLSIVIVAFAFGGPLAAQNQAPHWPQWRGPERTAAATAFTPPQTWPETLTQRWKVDVGLGYATPLIVGDRVFQFSRQGENEVMMALDAASGKVVWKSDGYPAQFTMMSATKQHGPGPKSTPAYADGRLFSIGMTGVVTAWDAATGKQLWQKPGSPNVPTFTTHAFSPLVDRGLVIFHVGGHDEGALTAFDVNTGAERWSWKGDGPGYGSPVVLDAGGTRQIVTITQKMLVGVDAATGALLWQRPFVSPNDTHSVTPAVFGDTVIVSSNGPPTMAVRIGRKGSQWVAETVWENADVPMRMSSPVLMGDMVVGLSTRNSGQYFGLDAKTGKTLWTSEGRQAGKASVAVRGDLMLSLEDDGELVVARATRTAFGPLKRYKVADTATWTMPSYSGNRIFVKDVSNLMLWTIN
jgi:outer membrane protein assembly factor BamB